MDIAGAKALKQRLGPNGADDAPRLPADVDVAEDAPPVYHWVGVRQAQSKTPLTPEDDSATRASLFRRVGLSLR